MDQEVSANVLLFFVVDSNKKLLYFLLLKMFALSIVYSMLFCENNLWLPNVFGCWNCLGSGNRVPNIVYSFIKGKKCAFNF